MRLGLATRTTVSAIEIVEAIQVIAKKSTVTHSAMPDSWAFIQRCVRSHLIRNSSTCNQHKVVCSLINHVDMGGNMWYKYIFKNKTLIRHGSWFSNGKVRTKYFCWFCCWSYDFLPIGRHCQGNRIYKRGASVGRNIAEKLVNTKIFTREH